MIYFGVDHSDPWWTKSFMETPRFIRVSLSDVRVIMVIMHILVEEFAMSGSDGIDSST
jgi:hypothetical protein